MGSKYSKKSSSRHSVSKNTNQRERYLRKILSSEGELNTTDFPCVSKEENYGEIIETFGRGVSGGFAGRHRIIPPINESQQNSKSLSWGNIIALATIILAIVLAIIGGVYKFGNLEGRFQENINKLVDTNKSLSELSNKIATIDATAKSIAYAAVRSGGNAPTCRRHVLFCVLCHL